MSRLRECGRPEEGLTDCDDMHCDDDGGTGSKTFCRAVKAMWAARRRTIACSSKPFSSGFARAYRDARSARAFWQLEDRIERFNRSAKSSIERVSAPGQRSRQRIHDDRRHHRARSPAWRREQKKMVAQAMGRSRGGLTTKIHALVDALGNPVEVMLSPGQASRLTCAKIFIEQPSIPAALLADKAFDADAFIGALNAGAITPGPSHRNTTRSPRHTISPSTANTIS